MAGSGAGALYRSVIERPPSSAIDDGVGLNSHSAALLHLDHQEPVQQTAVKHHQQQQTSMQVQPHAKQERDSSGRWKPICIPQQANQPLMHLDAQLGQKANAPPASSALSQQPMSLHLLTSAVPDQPVAKRQRLASRNVGDSSSPVDIFELPSPQLAGQVSEELLANLALPPRPHHGAVHSSLWELPPLAHSPVAADTLAAARPRIEDRRATLDVETETDHINDGYRCTRSYLVKCGTRFGFPRILSGCSMYADYSFVLYNDCQYPYRKQAGINCSKALNGWVLWFCHAQLLLSNVSKGSRPNGANSGFWVTYVFAASAPVQHSEGASSENTTLLHGAMQMAQVWAENCQGQPQPAQLLQMHFAGLHCEETCRAFWRGFEEASHHLRGHSLPQPTCTERR